MYSHWTPVYVYDESDGPQVKGRYIVTYDDGTLDILERKRFNYVTGHEDEDSGFKWIGRKQHRRVIAYSPAPEPYVSNESIVNVFIDDQLVMYDPEILNPNIKFHHALHWNGGVNVYFVTKSEDEKDE